MIYYTYIKTLNNKIYHRYLDEQGRDNIKIEKLDKYYLFFPYEGTGKTSYKGFPTEKPIKIKKYDNYFEYKEMRNSCYSGVFEGYGFTEEMQFILERYAPYKKDLTMQFKNMKILALDIEVYNGDNTEFPEAENAKYPISAITLKEIGKSKEYFVFTYRDFKPIIEKIENADKEKIHIKVCKNESDLIQKFFKFISIYKPHFLTGWYVIDFDLKYIANRTKQLFPVNYHQLFYSMIPFNIDISKIKASQFFINMSDLSYILGITVMDYKEIYQKLGKKLSSYSLNNVSLQELKKHKLDWKDETDYKTLSELYEKDFDLYVTYNIQDVNLIDLLERHLNFIKLVINFSYLTLINFDKALKTLKPAENLLTYYLIKNKYIPILTREEHVKENYPGGFVQEPLPGDYDWISVFDIISSYPNQIRSFNISNETLIKDDELPEEVRKMKIALIKKHRLKYRNEEYEETILNLSKNDKEKLLTLLKKYDITMSPALYFYKRKQGVIPKMISELFFERKNWKKKEHLLHEELNKKKR